MQQEIIQGYRLSPQQKHLWLLHGHNFSNAGYRACCLVRLTGELDTDLLRRALDQVTARHEILRTTFRLLKGMTIPVQVIDPEGRGSFVTHDLTALGDIEQLARLDQLILEAKSAQIDYEQLPLLRGGLVKQSSTVHQLILTAPALCADVLSLQHLVRQIADAYEHSQAEDVSHTELMQYADFAEWQNELLETEDASVARQYWKHQDLSGLAAGRLFFEKRLTSEQSFQPAVVTVDISKEATARIQAAAKAIDVSLSSFGLTCWQVLISRLTGRSHTVVGTAFDGRKFGELENAVGLFSKFLPMQNELPGSNSFEKLWKHTSDQEQEALWRREYRKGWEPKV